MTRGCSGCWGLFSGGVKIKTCPQILEDCFYEDREFPSGPRGVMHVLKEKARQK